MKKNKEKDDPVYCLRAAKARNVKETHIEDRKYRSVCYSTMHGNITMSQAFFDRMASDMADEIDKQFLKALGIT